MEEIKYTYCRICEACCGLKATVTDGILTKVTGNKNHIVSKGYICPRGLATLDIHNNTDRLKYPVKKVNGKFEKVDWASALKDIGQKLKDIREKYGNDSVAYYIGNPIAFDYSLTAYNKIALKTMGTRNFFYAGSQDCNNKFAASEEMFDSPILHPVPDIDHTEFLILWGTNPVVSKASLVSLTRPEERLKAIEKRGGRVIIIDPRKTETASLLGEHIFIRPDTDIYLMMAMLNSIISKNLYDTSIVSQYTKGFDDLKGLVSKYPAEKASKITGVDEDEIEQLAKDFSTSKNAAIYIGLGVNLGSFGTLGYWLVQCLNIITGRLDKKDSMLFPMHMLQNARLLEKLEKFKSLRKSRLGDFEPVMDALPAGIMADEILTPGAGQIKALIVICGNPLLTVPDGNKLEKAFKSLDLLVSADLFINETGGLSNYILPSKDFYERWDFATFTTMFNPVNALSYSEKVVDAEGEQKELWIILHEILMAAGYPFGGNPVLGKMASILNRVERIFAVEHPIIFRPEMLLKMTLIASGISFKKLKKSKGCMRLGEHPTGDFIKKWIIKERRKINLAPEKYLNAASLLDDFFEKEKNRDGYKMIGQRQKRTHNSWFHNVNAFFEKEKTNFVSINSQDAEMLGVAPDEIVQVKNENGSIRLPVKIVHSLMPGVISIPHGWGHDKKSGLNIAKQKPGANVNLLTASGPENLEPVCGMSKLTGVPVTVNKIN